MTQNVILCILDGWGSRDLDENNATRYAKNWQSILASHSHLFLNASEEYVGLPVQQMGNSEVGHMTIGLGRTRDQDLPRISKCIKSGNFPHEIGFQSLVKKTQSGSGRCHVIGLLSDGGIHSHISHFIATLHALRDAGLTAIAHPILDGRDTPPSSALNFVNTLDQNMSEHVIRGTVGGRFYAMDRDNRWDRIEAAYNAINKGDAENKNCPDTFSKSVAAAYEKNETDEFVTPTPLDGYSGIQKGDSIFFVNFRSDRMRQLATVFTADAFPHFVRSHPPLSCVAGMTEYSDELSEKMITLFSKQSLSDGLGETLTKHNLSQLRIAETEKYAHVTYFFNGGIEAPFDNEDRILVPSPNVSTYDLAPEMSAKIVTSHILDAMREKKHNVIIANYANPDMVGHTGVKSAIIKAIQCVDDILLQLVNSAKNNDWILLITADHGNVETMAFDDGSPHTAHTCNLVPFVIAGSNHNLALSCPKNHAPTLADIAPTLLDLLNIQQPELMTGKSLLKK